MTDKSERTPDGTALYIETWRKRSEDMRERLVFLCQDLAPSRSTYEYLETRTGIGASKWKNVFLKRQMPTIEMLMAMCHYRPTHANWLLTGSTATERQPAIFEAAPSDDDWKKFIAHREWLERKKENGNKEG